MNPANQATQILLTKTEFYIRFRVPAFGVLVEVLTNEDRRLKSYACDTFDQGRKFAAMHYPSLPVCMADRRAEHGQRVIEAGE